MKLGPEGAAYFVEKVEKLNEEDSVVNSPISSKNNIKITKKVNGKMVRLNKQGLIAKLKRYKVL